MHTADYCPLTSMIQLDCSVQPDGSNKIAPMDIEYFGSDSRCIVTDLERPLCMKFECNVQRRKAVISIGGGQVLCENDGDMMEIPGIPEGRLKCPSFSIVCPQ